MNSSNGIDLKIRQQYYIEHLVNLYLRYFNAISDDDSKEIHYLEELIIIAREDLISFSD